MRIVVDYYFDDLEQRCSNPKCSFIVGPYSDEWNGPCPLCGSHLNYHKAFGTEAERSIVRSYREAKISGLDY